MLGDHLKIQSVKDAVQLTGLMLGAEVDHKGTDSTGHYTVTYTCLHQKPSELAVDQEQDAWIRPVAFFAVFCCPKH